MSTHSICVVTQQYNQVISGIGLHARNLVARLVADGHHVAVVAPVDQRPPGDLSFPFVGVSPPLFRRTQARWLSLAWSFARRLALLERRDAFDLVHFTDARESLFCRMHTPVVGNVNDTYAADVRHPVYYHRHYTDWLLRWGYYRFVKSCEALALPRLQGIIANSHHTANVVAARYHVSRGRLHLCYKSIDPEQYTAALRFRMQGSAHPPRVLFVGGNMQRKGLPTLIQAASRVLTVLPDAEFWVVGGDAAAPRMEALCRANGVDAHFRFWGWKSQTELPNLYAQADVFVMPSLMEAFGVALLEAMASGVPVIGTRVGGITELIDHGHNGLLVAPDDVNELAQALIELLTDAALRERLRQAGLETVRRFDVERMMQCTYSVYQAVLASPPRA